MEYWIFFKKELNFIVDLMIQVLIAKPDNSELSVTRIFQEALHAEFVEGKDANGYIVRGLQIADIELERGKFLHDLIKWDFENGIWNIGYGQGFELLRLFERKAIRAGFVIDDSMIRGMKLGLPHNISSVYRRKDNLLASFKGIKEECIYKSTNERYNVRCRYEISSYKHPSSQGYAKRLMQLWRIPAGCSTGIIANEGRVTCIVMNGKCLFEASRWNLYCETTDD